ncbi:MAG: hypothetical protein RLZZ292_1998 [Bacteroidota bacterium]|jgi:hypothetical protein
MELKIEIGYDQVVDIIKQLPINQVARLLVDTKGILEQQKNPLKDITSFQQFLLSAPTMSEKEYDIFLENRKLFNQWRTK